MSLASQMDSANLSGLQSRAFRGYEFVTGGETQQTERGKAVEQVGSGLQDFGTTVAGGAASVAAAKGVGKFVRAVKGSGEGDEQAAAGTEEDPIQMGDIAETNIDDAAGAADAGGEAAAGAGEAVAGAAEGAAAGADVAGSILAGGASVEEVMAASGITETPVGLAVAAGLGVVMGIAGFFVHKHSNDKRFTTTTPVQTVSTGAQNFFDQAGAGNVA